MTLHLSEVPGVYGRLDFAEAAQVDHAYVRVSALTVFEQPVPATDFIISRSFELIGPGAEPSAG